MIKAHMWRDKNKPFKTYTKNKFKICKIRTFLIKLENGFDTVERLRCIEASTPLRAIARAENSVGVVHPSRAESRWRVCARCLVIIYYYYHRLSLRHRQTAGAAPGTTCSTQPVSAASLFGCVAVPHVGDLESIGDDVGDLESIGDDVGDLESIGDDYKRPSTSRRTSAILLFHSIIYFVP